MTAIKICGLGRECDIDFVNEAKPDCIGFILNVPKSRRNVSVERAAELRSRLLPGIRAVGVFVDQPVETVREAAERIPLDVIQLHGREDDRYIAELKNRTDRPVWKAFQIKGPDDLEAAQRCTADEILLDGGTGSGVAFDWSVLSAFPRPFILAGGLTPELIPEAVRTLRPKMIDLSSGVETDGLKDRNKITAAVLAAHGVPAECTAEKEGRA